MELHAHRANVSALMFLVLVGVAGLVILQSLREPLLTPPLAKPVPLPPLSAHALKHREAEAVWRFLNSIDTRFCRYECGDRVYYACRMTPHKWAFAVVVDGVVTITAFITDRNYAMSQTRDNDRCRPFIAVAHP